MREIRISAGQSAVILRRQFSSMVTRYEFTAKAAREGDLLDGTVEVRGSAWIFPKGVVRTRLQSVNQVTAGFWDTFYKVIVTADKDLIITVQGGRYGGLRWWLIIALALVVLALALFLILGLMP